MRVTPGDAVITTAGTYPTFSYFAAGAGASIHEVAYLSRIDTEGGEELIPDLAGIADAAHAAGAVVAYLANPDNPTGHVFSAAEVNSRPEMGPL
jgi:histidinol-phosphate aminotransferase